MLCDCGRKAIYYRRWEGRYYCSRCLSRQVERRFKKTISDNNLFRKSEKIAVALSGGKDSSVLLCLFRKFFSHMNIFAITIDEGIRGYRDKSLLSAKKLTKKLGVKHYVFSFRKEFGLGMDNIKTKKYCSYCGVLRRYLLNKKARGLGADKLAVAHNLDDEAQSVMMNLVRGDFSRFQRLGAFPVLVRDKKFVPRIKPLRDIPEKELMLYALANGINFYQGAGCLYSHDNVRRDIQAVINNLEEKYPGTKLQIVNFYDRIRPMIIQRTGRKIRHCSECKEPSSQDVCKACELLKGIRKK